MTSRRISNTTAFFLIAIAIFVDGLQGLINLLTLIPLIGIVIALILGIFVDILVIFLFAIWFSHINVSLMSKYPLGFLGTIVLENIPIINTAPGWTFFVVKTIIKERMKYD